LKTVATGPALAGRIAEVYHRGVRWKYGWDYSWWRQWGHLVSSQNVLSLVCRVIPHASVQKAFRSSEHLNRRRFRSDARLIALPSSMASF